MVVIEAVRIVPGNDLRIQPMYCHVHQAQLGIVFHLLLTVEGHGHIRVRAILLSEVRRGNEHAAAAASGIQHNTAFGLDDVHNHAHQRFGREENAVIRGHRRGKLVEKVLINAPDDVVLNVVQGAVVEDAQQFPQEFVLERRVGLGQHAAQLRAFCFYQRHGAVDLFADVDFTRFQVQQIFIACFFRQKDSAFLLEVDGFHR